ncbi:MAG: class I SAM-dependent methyltransferase, partial [Oscillospiraceae bacterium]|nr:class I SAM-dependent methyltransferase [Oscillospiraceae bacterium]
MALLRKFFNQTRKPEGGLGKLMVGGMNSGHAKLADWGMTHLPDTQVFQVVDIGCGGGRNAG